MNCTCTLCELPLPNQPVIDESGIFCCTGCHVVYTILSTQPAATTFKDSPLFLEALRTGLISNPKLLEEINLNQADLTEAIYERLYLEIEGLWCPTCVEVIKLVLLKQRGIRNCVVDYSTDLASIEYSPRYISKETLLAIIKRLGYSPAFLTDSARQKGANTLNLRFAIAAFCAFQIMMFSYPIYVEFMGFNTKGYGLLFSWLSAGVSLPIATYCIWPIALRAWHALRLGFYGMELLVLIGVFTALFLSFYQLINHRPQVYFDSMSAIVVFVLLGKIIESKAKFNAREAVVQLHRAMPRRGKKRFEDRSIRYVPIKEMNVGDFLVAGIGDKIVMDGVIIEGEGGIDESLMTGESIPLHKKIGDQVLAGSIVTSGTVVYQVTRLLQSSILQSIIGMVEQQMEQKTVAVRVVDSIIRWFVPAVFFIALVSGLLTSFTKGMDEGVLRAISVLLISCPCAIGIAAPLVESKLMSRLASMGAIIRNRNCLPFLGKEGRVAFDKTGTITEGKFTIHCGLEGLTLNAREALQGLTQLSNHPIAVAIRAVMTDKSMNFDRVEEHPGKGLRGYIGEHVYMLGSAEFHKLYQIAIPQVKNQRDEIATIVFFSCDGQCIAQLYLGDRIKEDVKEGIAKIGPQKTVLVSGDSISAVKAVASACLIPEYYASCNPMQKKEIIEKLKKSHIVTMIGDGINDAPALSAAHVGISVVSATDLSIQASDILLTTHRFDIIPSLLNLARKAHAITKQNLFWAFFYNVIGIPLAAIGYLTPIYAAIAMVLSSLIVLFNSSRLTRYTSL